MSSTVEPTTGEAKLIRRLQRFHNDNVVDGVPCGDWHAEVLDRPLSNKGRKRFVA